MLHRKVEFRALLSVVLPVAAWVLAPIIIAVSMHVGSTGTISGIQERNDAGVVAFFLVAGVDGVLGIVGIILALNARRKIRSAGGTQTGEGLAVAGLILNTIVILVGVLAVAVAVFFLGLRSLDVP